MIDVVNNIIDIDNISTSSKLLYEPLKNDTCMDTREITITTDSTMDDNIFLKSKKIY